MTTERQPKAYAAETVSRAERSLQGPKPSLSNALPS